MQTIELKTIVRQSGDTDFISLLTPVRVGRCSEATSAALAACHVESKPLPRDGIMPTKLYCKNANVDAENSAHLAKLPGAPVRLPATDTFKVSLTLTLALALALALALTLALTLTPPSLGQRRPPRGLAPQALDDRARRRVPRQVGPGHHRQDDRADPRPLPAPRHARRHLPLGCA